MLLEKANAVGSGTPSDQDPDHEEHRDQDDDQNPISLFMEVLEFIRASAGNKDTASMQVAIKVCCKYFATLRKCCSFDESAENRGRDGHPDFLWSMLDYLARQESELLA